MKIAFLSFYSGEMFRGVETYVHELVNGLVALGHDVTVFQNGPAVKDAKYKLVSISLPVDWKRPGGKFRFYTDYWATLVGKFTKAALKKIESGTDVVVATNGGWQSFFCRLWTWHHGVKLVIPGQSGPGIDDRVNLWCFPDRFIVPTSYASLWAKKVNPFVKTVTIPNGVDTAIFKAQGEKVNLQLSHPIILCVAALVPLKRLQLAIKAVSGLDKGSLVLVGRGELKEELQKMGDALLPGRFQILEAAHKDIHKIYRSADLFTFPTSPWESFGIVMLEAMATNLPIVASDDPIRREIVGDAGIFVDPTDTPAYTKALENALSHKWGNIPRKQSEKFSWDDVAKKYETLFQELVPRRNNEG